jgi:hypothetical protein
MASGTVQEFHDDFECFPSSTVDSTAHAEVGNGGLSSIDGVSCFLAPWLGYCQG